MHTSELDQLTNNLYQSNFFLKRIQIFFTYVTKTVTLSVPSGTRFTYQFIFSLYPLKVYFYLYTEHSG